MVKLDKHLLYITILLLAAFSLIELPTGTDTLLFLVTIVIVGIPHGALDHVIEFNDTRPDKLQLVKFYSIYIGLIGAVFACWYFFPQVSFLSFIAISAYHFGQSQLFYLNLKGRFVHLYYLSWGMLLLSMIIYTNIAECMAIFDSLEWLEVSQLNSTLWLSLLIKSGTLWITLTCLYLAKGQISMKEFGRELLLLAILLGSSLVTNAVITFTIYFGIWHSFRSLLLTFQSIRKNVGNSISKFIKAAMPFSVAGILFLGLGYYLSFHFDLGISIYMIFIIIISTLTVPHLFVMNKLYNPLH
ncbi:Brp/Blh family beta-carotene 15,15'-dioxygenase [Fulvivirga lutea]|uniref:Probable beta-carotene 15,15'-dioxygenase n=1 Tax=Fulvivirga lutea TaxID=2810512 RepID=A0A974WGH4_9BACT|nr:Brp/Blh family beta-carotene 15,15'-dioxygenase [Fulvivirga lutea]QSE97620.1 Brp/Blh family beta-carotene 15,15'-dioxygenase [Fulvivirga lutea]